MNKKAQLIAQLQEQLRKGEIKDRTIITKVELADPRLIDMAFDKFAKVRQVGAEIPTAAPVVGSEQEGKE